MVNLILCGGAGTRLWPISRNLMPKQFVKIFSEKSLFQLTVERNQDICDSNYIVSNTEQYFLAFDQLEELGVNENKFLLEPIGKNTAPAIALACLGLDKDEIVLVTPADHLINDQSAYIKVVNEAKGLAQENNIVTFGIKPGYPETGYGYIEADGYDVVSFKEKPNLELAKEYIKNKNYYWNSGMFCFKAGVFLEELKKYSPEILESCQKAFNSSHRNQDFIRISHNEMDMIPEDSIDFAVMEKSDIVKVIPSDISWSDVGSFDSLSEELPKDQVGNSILSINDELDNNKSNKSPIINNSRNNLIVSSKQVATIDVDDLIIVDTYDALLVSKKGSSQKVKEAVKELKNRKSELHDFHLTVHRPWGIYTVLDDSHGYKIKKIVVKPGKRLSMQKHFHRSEHWIIVSGTATVTNNEQTYIVRANESTYIKMGEFHRLANDGKIDLVLVEVQVGEYTGEDDIVRIDDDFYRGEDS